jgi:glycosyltransferase involved in cell wall biosynthesis
MKKVALFFPWLKSKGGAEKTILEIIKNKDYKFDLYTWYYNESTTFEEFKKLKVNVLGRNTLPKNKILRGLFLLKGFLSKIPLDDYDYFLICTSGVGEFITFRNYKPGKTIVCCFTILRDAYPKIVKWNLKHSYSNIFYKLFYLISTKIYNIFERKAWKKIEKPFFISEEVANRAVNKGLWNKKPKIIYVPADLDKFKQLSETKGKYFLYHSRINNPKRQDLVIKAWKEFIRYYPKEKLIISGGLENKKYFDKLVKLSENENSIEVKTGLTNKEVLKLYQNSKAVIFVPFLEDFGIVPFEALAAGKSLIAVDEGGYVDLVKNVKQYYSINEAETEQTLTLNILSALKKFMKSKVKPKKIILKQLNPKVFQSKLKEMLK